MATHAAVLLRSRRSLAALNVALAENAALESDKPVRGVLVIARRYAAAEAQRLASEYRDAGVGALELRVTPLGGADESVAKIRSVFAIADAFTATGIQVVLGQSGNIGHKGKWRWATSRSTRSASACANKSTTPQRSTARRSQRETTAQGNRFGAVVGVYAASPSMRQDIRFVDDPSAEMQPRRDLT